MDYSKVREHLGIKIVNYEKNQELLKEVPYKTYLNLAILFFCAVENETIGNGIILIRENHLKMWNINIETVYADAMKNAVWKYPVKVYPMPELLKEYPEEVELWKAESASVLGEGIKASLSEYMEEFPMYVLTNEQKVFGAAVLLYEGVLKRVARKMCSNLAILPSSIHEIITVPVRNMAEAAAYEAMVQEINATQLEAEDVLSDQVYYYERHLDRLVIAKDAMVETGAVG